MAHAIDAASEETPGLIPRFFGVFRYSRRAVALVWTTSRRLTFIMAALTIIAGVLPAAIAYVGKLIVDGVVAAMAATEPDTAQVLTYVVMEAGIVALLAACEPGPNPETLIEDVQVVAAVSEPAQPAPGEPWSLTTTVAFPPANPCCAHSSVTA